MGSSSIRVSDETLEKVNDLKSTLKLRSNEEVIINLVNINTKYNELLEITQLKKLFG